MIRVVLVDDQKLIRQGIRSLLDLAGDVQVVGEAGDGEEALTVIPQAAPDVVLLDLRMPRMDGVAVLKALQAERTCPPTIVLTTFDDDTALLEAVVADAQLGQNARRVILDRPLRRPQRARDLAVAVATGHQPQDLHGRAPS